MNSNWLNYLPGVIRKRLEGRNVLQEAVGNTGWLLADRVLRMGVGLFVGAWVARYLGPSLYGLLNFSGTLVFLFSSLATLGLEAIVVRDLVRATTSEEDILGTTFSLRFLAGIVSYLVAVCTIFIIRPHDEFAQIIVAIFGWMLVLNAFDTIDLWFQSRVLSKYVVYAKNVGFLLSAFLRIVLIVTHASVISFAIANLLEIAIGAIGLLIVYAKNGQSIKRWKFRLALARNLVANGWPIVLGGIISMICFRIDQVMLGQLVDSKEVGIYASAVRIAELWFFIPSAIISSVFPNIIKAKECDENEFYRRLQKLYSLLAFVGYVVAVPITFLSGFLINVLFGQAYAAATPMLIILVWSNLFANLAMARGAYLLAMNWIWPLLFLNLAGAVTNIGLNLLLIPRFGGIGAAIASCVSYWLAAHGACYFFKPLRKTGNMLTKALLSPRFW
jgi:O-antigen/teichoic acid export membrane protein